MSNHAKHRHTFGIRSLAALLAFYAMGGVLLTMLMIGGRYEHLDWTLLAAAGFAFTVTAGSSALTVWRLERSAPWWLIACGVAGAAMCLLMPAAAPSVATGRTWMAAALGAAFFFVFLLVAAEYVRRRMRGCGDGRRDDWLVERVARRRSLDRQRRRVRRLWSSRVINSPVPATAAART